MVSETRTATVGGEEIQIDNIPALDQADLYLLRHTVTTDATVDNEEITLDPPNPVAGETAMITARILNFTDIPVDQGVPGQVSSVC